jgi:hypothetical protein
VDRRTLRWPRRRPGGPRHPRRVDQHGAAPSSASSTATTVSDGGGLVTAALEPVDGAEQIARFLVEISGRTPGLTILERSVNGQPGLVAQLDGVTVTVMAFEVAGDRIKHIWAVRNPDKLRPWTGL